MSNEMVCWNSLDPLQPVESGESSAANRALRDYAHMGHSRSLKRLHNQYLDADDPPTTSYMTLADWSKRLDWQQRISCWEEMERKREAHRWRERRDEVREREWENATRLQTMVSNLLDQMPSFLTSKEAIAEEGSPQVITSDGIVVQKGKPTIMLRTVKLNVSAALRIIKLASDISRRAAEMEDRSMDRLIEEIDFDKLAPDQISRLADGEHILDVLDIRK